MRSEFKSTETDLWVNGTHMWPDMKKHGKTTHFPPPPFEHICGTLYERRSFILARVYLQTYLHVGKMSHNEEFYNIE